MVFFDCFRYLRCACPHFLAAEMLVTFENSASAYFDDYSPPVWIDSRSALRFGNIVHGVVDSTQMLEALDLARQRNAGYTYLTDDSGLNPYDVLPIFWSREVAAAQGMIFHDGFEG